MSNSKRMFDAGNGATLHDRLNGHLQTGDKVRAIIGTEKDWDWHTGEIVGWSFIGDTDERHARVRFVLPTCTLTKTIPLQELQPVAADRWELRKRAERLRDEGDTTAALLAEDLYKESTD